VSYPVQQLVPAPPADEGDKGFIGWKCDVPPNELPPGYTFESENKRYVTGRGDDRGGTRTPAFANEGLSGAILGSGVYRNPNGLEVALLAAHNKVWVVRAGATMQQLKVEVALSGAVVFAQQFDKVLLHCSDATVPVQEWDGLSPDGFVQTEASKALGDGIVLIPNVPWSINYGDRAWFPVGRDSIAASDIDDYTIYDSDQHVFRVNVGTSDGLVGAFPFGPYLILGKDNSFDILGPIPGDLGDNFQLAASLGLAPASAPPPVANPIIGPEGLGIKARTSWIAAGAEGFFLSQSGSGGGGIYRMVFTSPPYIDPIPVSNDISPFFARVNWQYANLCAAGVDGIFAKWALPIDGSLFNNAVVTFNLVTRKWMALDLWWGRARTDRKGRTAPPEPNPMRLDNLLSFDFYGRRRLYAIDNAQPAVRLLEEGLDDQLGPANARTGDERKTYPIRSIVRTRGYSTQGWDGAEWRHLDFVDFTFSIYDPNFTVTQVLEGVGRETPLTQGALTTDRQKYNALGETKFQLDNAKDDFGAPGRQDYSIRAGDGFEQHWGETVPLQQEQEKPMGIELNSEGRYASFRVENNGGTCALVSAHLRSQEAARSERSA
jgi:hypothetical protein